jgi:hypothetical protein
VEVSAHEELEIFFFSGGFSAQMISKKVHFSGPILIEKVSEIVLTPTTILKRMQLAKWM